MFVTLMIQTHNQKPALSLWPLQIGVKNATLLKNIRITSPRKAT
jgi:hypothetical protein